MIEVGESREVNTVDEAISNLQKDRERSLSLYQELLKMNEMSLPEAEVILDAEADDKEGWKILQAKRAVYSNLLTATVQLLRSLADSNYKLGQLAKIRFEIAREHEELERLRQLEEEGGTEETKEDIDNELSGVAIDITEEAKQLSKEIEENGEEEERQ